MAIGKKKQELLVKIARYVMMCVFVIPMILPLFWMISTSLKEGNLVFTNPPQWFPKTFKWSNYADAIVQTHFWKRFGNTLFIAVVSVVGQILSNMCVGYAIARVKFPGRKVWFYLIIGTMMLPSVVTLIPVYKVWSALGFVNTFLPLIIPPFLAGSFYTFLVRQFMMTIPKSYDEAATLDGAGRLQILVRVIAPMCKPCMATIAVMTFQGAWNDYLGPMLYLIKDDLWTLSITISRLMGSNYGIEWNVCMAADVLYLIPIVIVFFCAQDFFMQGLGSMNNAGVK